MNILFVADVGAEKVIGGAERVLHAFATRCRLRGHHVNVLSLACDSLEDGAAPRLPQPRLFGVVKSARRILRSFRETCRSNPPHLINFHQPLSAFIVLLCPEARSIPKVYAFLSSAPQEYATRLRKATSEGAPFSLWHILNIAARRWLEAYSLGRSDCILVMSEFSRKVRLDVHGPTSTPVALLPGGVDTARFKPPRDRFQLREEIAPGCSHLLFTVRNLVPRMGLENLIRSMVRIVSNHPDVLLVIGGEGPLKTELTDLARRLGMEKRIRFEGFIPEESLPSYYQASDIFVLPTLMLEGFGLVAVEALACGTPVVGAPVGGIVEVLGDLDERLICEGSEPHHISSRIIYFLDHPEELAGIRERCRDYVLERYDWDLIVERLEGIFARMIASA